MIPSSPVNSSPTIMNPYLGSTPQSQQSLQQQQQTPAGPVNHPTTPLYPLTTNNHQLANIKFLNKQDREALLQYTKHFVRKAVQIVVQARLGEKKPTKSRVYAYNTDWFNLSVKDLAQITTMTKNSLGNVESLFAASSSSSTLTAAPFCIEISLKTPENQTMILETWCILFNEQLVDPTQKVCYSVYKKMSLVLRSLICITRSIPTYQLSRRQNSDTYVLLYRMYTGEPIVHHLGENYATAKVGTVGTPVGSLIVNVAYRTRLTMTPQNSYTNEYAGGILIKDDHFVQDAKERRQSESSSLGAGGGASSNRYSPLNHMMMMDSPPNNNNDRSPKGLNPIEQSSNSSNSSLSAKRSSSNLNTIVEVASPLYKTQPIPMKPSASQQQIGNVNMQSRDNRNSQIVKRYSSDHPMPSPGDETNLSGANTGVNFSNEEFNSSSVASTPDTIYYFKLKSAAFVPSASFTNNYSTSFGSLPNTQVPIMPPNSQPPPHSDSADMPPFITLLANDLGNLNTFDSASGSGRSNNQAIMIQRNNNNYSSNEQMIVAQSPPPPNSIITNEMSSMRKGQQYHNLQNSPNDMVSPCSLPNFKLLDNLMAGNNSHNSPNNNSGALPDDFVFIEPKKIAFGLSNAADDLRTFFRACENAPMCESFMNEPPLNEILRDLDQQLLTYEAKVGEFDELIKSLENN